MKDHIMKTAFIAVAALVTITACTEANTTPDPLTKAVSGRTMVSGDNRFTAGANGALIGTLADGATLAGKWRISGGKWCRTLTQPEQFKGPEVCQDAALTDGQLVIVGSSGEPRVYTIE